MFVHPDWPGGIGSDVEKNPDDAGRFAELVADIGEAAPAISTILRPPGTGNRRGNEVAGSIRPPLRLILPRLTHENRKADDAPRR